MKSSASLRLADQERNVGGGGISLAMCHRCSQCLRFVPVAVPNRVALIPLPAPPGVLRSLRHPRLRLNDHADTGWEVRHGDA
jgi:hypothetical protein